MSHILKRVQSGDRLNIPAATFNTFVDAAQDFLRRQRDIGRTPVAAYVEKVCGEGDFAGLGIGT